MIRRGSFQSLSIYKAQWETFKIPNFLCFLPLCFRFSSSRKRARCLHIMLFPLHSKGGGGWICAMFLQNHLSCPHSPAEQRAGILETPQHFTFLLISRNFSFWSECYLHLEAREWALDCQEWHESIRKPNEWESSRSVNPGQMSEGQRWRHTLNSVGETLPLLGEKFIFCELSEEIFLCNLSLCASTCEIYPFTFQWCCSSNKDKVSLYLDPQHFVICLLWTRSFLTLRSMRWAVLKGSLAPSSLLLVLIPLDAQFLVHRDKRWCLQSPTLEPMSV